MPVSRFISIEEHTVSNFKKNLWLTDIFDKTAASEQMSEERKADILINAHEQVNEILSKREKYRLPKDKEAEIDKIVKKAEQVLAK